MTPRPYVLTKTTLTVIAEDKTILVINSEHALWGQTIEAIKEGKWELAISLMNQKEAVKVFGQGRITVKGNSVYFEDTPLVGSIVDRILEFIEEGIDASPMLNFLDKIMDNPSKRCVDQLFSFLEHGNMPIDPDGDFYAYKAVTSNWMDKHTRTIDNSIGQIVSVTRNMVDDDPTHGCSNGLHAGSMEYVNGFADAGDKIIIVKINPKDVVSVPNYDTRKLRTCRYEVTQEFERILPNTTYGTESCDNCCCSCSSNECDEERCGDCGEKLDNCECDFEFCEECGFETCDCQCQDTY